MKFCNQCGNQLDDNAVFCNKCGAQQTVAQPTAPVQQSAQPVQNAQQGSYYQQPINQQYSQQPAMPQAPAEQPKKKKTALIVILAVVAVVIIAVVVIVVVGSHSSKSNNSTNNTVTTTASASANSGTTSASAETTTSSSGITLDALNSTYWASDSVNDDDLSYAFYFNNGTVETYATGEEFDGQYIYGYVTFDAVQNGLYIDLNYEGTTCYRIKFNLDGSFNVYDALDDESVTDTYVGKFTKVSSINIMDGYSKADYDSLQE